MKPTFANLIEVTATDAKVSRAVARRVLEAFFAQLAEAVWSWGRVFVPGLALFSVRLRRDRRSPLASAVTVPAHRFVFARVAKIWRRRV